MVRWNYLFGRDVRGRQWATSEIGKGRRHKALVTHNFEEETSGQG